MFRELPQHKVLCHLVNQLLEREREREMEGLICHRLVCPDAVYLCMYWAEYIHSLFLFAYNMYIVLVVHFPFDDCYIVSIMMNMHLSFSCSMCTN